MAKRPQKNKIALICLEIIRFSTYLIFFTPLILSSRFFFPFVGPKSLYFMGLAEIIFFSWLILISIDPSYRPKFNPLLLALIIYLFIFILASVLGVNLSYSFWSKYERMTGILMQFHLFAFFLVLSSVFKDDDFRKFFAFSNFVAILVSLVALANLKNPTMRGGGTIGNDSFLGTYLLFNVFFALYLIFKTKDFGKILSLISFSILTISLLLIGVNLENLSFSQALSAIFFSQGARAAKLSFYGGLVLLFFFWLIASQRKVLKIFGSFFLVSSLIFGSFVTFSLLTQPEGIFRKVIEKEVGSFGGRFPVWQGAWKGFLERPWLGWGPENFEFSFIKYYDPCMPTSRCGGEIWFDRAHNIIFDTLISTGIFGTISYLLIFAAIFYILWKNFLKNKTDFFAPGIFTSLFVAYFVQNLTVFDMVSSYLMFFLSLAFVASFEKEKEFFREIREPKPPILTLIALGFLVSFTFFIILPTMSDANVILAIRAPAFSKERISFYKRSLSLSPLGKFQIRQFFAENTISAFYSAQTSSENMTEELKFLIGELEKSIKECPLDYRSYLRLGQLLNLYSQFDNSKIFEAEEILRKAIEISPKNQQGYWSLAQNMLYQGKFDEAIFLAQKAIDLEPNLESAHSILIQVALMAGKKDLAKQKFEEAIKINPNWEEDLRKILEGS
jgi:putative inorganic carbon (HCO3(-)) transporter